MGSSRRRLIFLAACCLAAWWLPVVKALALAPSYPGFRIPYVVYTTREGLAQNQVRSVAEDTYGQVWIGTQNGLSMFDGHGIRTYGRDHGIPKGSIQNLAIDRKGHVVGMTRSTLFRFDGTRARSWVIPGEASGAGFTVLDNGMILVCTHTVRMVVVGDSLLPIRKVFPALDRPDLLFNRYDSVRRELYCLDNGRPGRVLIFGMEGRFKDTLDLIPQGLEGQAILSTTDALLLAIQDGPRQRYLKYTSQGLTPVFEADCSHYDRNTRSPATLTIHRPDLMPPVFILQSPRGNVVWVWRRGRAEPLFDLLFNSIHFVRKNASGRLLLGTDQGLVVAHLNGWESLASGFCENPWSVVPLPGQDKVLIGCHRRGIMEFDRNGALLQEHGFGPPNLQDNQIFPGARPMPGGRWVFGGFRGLYSWSAASGVRAWPLGMTQEAMVWDPFRSCVLAAGSELSLIEPGGEIRGKIPIPAELSQTVSCTDLMVGRDGSVWLSCWGGVGRLPREGKAWELFTQEAGTLPFESAYSLAADTRGRIWCGGSEGLMMRPAGGGAFQAVLPALIRDQVSQLLFAGADTLLVVGSKEFFILRTDGVEPRLLAHFDHQTGFQVLEPAENGSNLDERGYLWVAAGSGIHRFHVQDSEAWRQGKPILLVDQLNDAFMRLDQLRLPAMSVQGERLIVRYRVIGPFSEKYRLQFAMGNKGSWQDAPGQGTAIIDGLVEGAQTVRLRAVIDGLAESDWPMVAMPLEGHIPILQRTGVQAVLLGILVFLASWGGVTAVSRMRAKRDLRRMLFQVQQSRLKTIQAQLNPHFLFNAMASLQNTIQNRDPRQASEQLVRLSRLIRQVLEFSVEQAERPGELPLVSLEQELALLKDYVILEQQQREPGFDFHLIVDPGMEEENPSVPPLLIQPFLENSIHHGLGPMRERGNVWVHIDGQVGTLRYRIEDDGIGRQASMEAKSGSDFTHRSHGVSLLQERIRILNAMGMPCRLEISDRVPRGTIVDIEIKTRE